MKNSTKTPNLLDDLSLQSQNTQKTTGLLGELSESYESTSELGRELVHELNEGFTLLNELEPAVTFFGGARIKPDDRFYHAAHKMGELLADANIPPRTGAGPGIMAAVPAGFRERLGRDHADYEAAAADRERRGLRALTQGFNIILPREQSINPDIDISMELGQLPTRKLMLYQNALGLIVFPGGFGTLDELFEVWRLKVAGFLDYPLVLFDREFWEPLADALIHCGTIYPSAAISPDWLSMVQLVDSPEEAIAAVTSPHAVRAIVEPLASLGRRIATELVEGLNFLESLTPAVTVLGGSRLTNDDLAIEHATELARILALEGVPTRTAGPGQLSVALARGGHAGSEYLPQQAFGMRRSDAQNIYGADRVHLVNDRLTHKVLLTEGSRAVVALPGGLGTLDELFSILCQLQTRKIPARRVILLGSDYWTPLFQVIRQQMHDGERQTISLTDLNLVTITDDPAHAAQLALQPF